MKKHKRLSKKRLRQRLSIIGVVLELIVFVIAFFNFAMAINGNWDDLSLWLVCLMPAFAVATLILALYNISKNGARGREAIPALFLVLFTALFLSYVLIFAAIRIATTG